MVIRFYASIRDITGKREIEWNQETPTLGELLHRLSDHYGPRFRRWMTDGENLGDAVIILINGEDA